MFFLRGPSNSTAIIPKNRLQTTQLENKTQSCTRQEITAGKELPFFSRAEVAKHNTAEEPYMIIHNKVLNAVSPRRRLWSRRRKKW